MKKFLFITALSLSAMLAKAQHVELGLKAGVNFASIQQSNSGYKSKTGVNGGLLAHIHLNKSWAIQPELVYSEEGAKYTSNNVKHDLNLNYLNIPVLLQYMTPSGFRLQTGPQIGLLLSAKDEVGDVAIDRKDNLSSTNFSWSFGAGYLLPVGLGFDARYNLGLSNINDVDNSPKTKASVFQLGIFYQFSKSR